MHVLSKWLMKKLNKFWLQKNFFSIVSTSHPLSQSVSPRVIGIIIDLWKLVQSSTVSVYLWGLFLMSFWVILISRLPLILYPYSEFRFGFYEKFYTAYSVLKIFRSIRIEIENRRKVNYRGNAFSYFRLFLDFVHLNIKMM